MVDRPGSDAVISGMKGGGYHDLHSEYQRRVVEGGDPVIRSHVAEIAFSESTPTRPSCRG